ncbi:hypothetical protein T459_02498 [Capsicum annuum]|uniref:Myb/SANT-like domain-containing protein n=1 Tax=Capsicum annuum TaxID=4072 RepID=A0A2G3AK47_CAPAN|nr:hypothetical protein FXO37_27964 [Capsicum annuum]PHT94616.1 hypothetical protein T459_02498 [Capsicum annuum]
MSKPRGSNADKWTGDDTSILIYILHDDARNYGFNGSTINAPRWRGIIDEFWSKFEKKDIFDKQQIKFKHNRLRTDTKNFKELLLNCSGYGWDPVTNTVTCLSDIWTAHLSVVCKCLVKDMSISSNGIESDIDIEDCILCIAVCD